MKSDKNAGKGSSHTTDDVNESEKGRKRSKNPLFSLYGVTTDCIASINILAAAENKDASTGLEKYLENIEQGIAASLKELQARKNDYYQNLKDLWSKKLINDDQCKNAIEVFYRFEQLMSKIAEKLNIPQNLRKQQQLSFQSPKFEQLMSEIASKIAKELDISQNLRNQQQLSSQSLSAEDEKQTVYKGWKNWKKDLETNREKLVKHLNFLKEIHEELQRDTLQRRPPPLLIPKRQATPARIKKVDPPGQ